MISEKIPSVRSVSIGVWVHVGSRDETPDVNGICHFIEHMHFKGTRRRTSFQIAQALEALGGTINAFTSRENTCYYARVLNEHLPNAMEVLGDILNNSTFSPTNLKKEKLVILEEIKDVADSPSEFIHDLFAEQMWNSHPLGHPIMGNAEKVAGLSRSSVVDFIRQNYVGPHIVVAASGDVSHRKLVELTRRHFKWSAGNPGRIDRAPVPVPFSRKAHRNRTKQTHVCIGFPSVSFADADRYAILALNNILSGGMSSRLFQSVREKAGYCYNIYSFQEFFRDTGLFCIYFGADQKSVVKAIDLIIKELRWFKHNLLNRRELGQIKEQLKGNLMLSLESTTSRMNRIARQELMLGSYVGLDETIRNIDNIKAAEVRNVANRVCDLDRLTCCTLGPTQQKNLDDVGWTRL